MLRDGDWVVLPSTTQYYRSNYCDRSDQLIKKLNYHNQGYCGNFLGLTHLHD
jgi:hypothetical protein